MEEEYNPEEVLPVQDTISESPSPEPEEIDIPPKLMEWEKDFTKLLSTEEFELDKVEPIVSKLRTIYLQIITPLDVEFQDRYKAEIERTTKLIKKILEDTSITEQEKREDIEGLILNLKDEAIYAAQQARHTPPKDKIEREPEAGEFEIRGIYNAIARLSTKYDHITPNDRLSEEESQDIIEQILLQPLRALPKKKKNAALSNFVSFADGKYKFQQTRLHWLGKYHTHLTGEDVFEIPFFLEKALQSKAFATVYGLPVGAPDLPKTAPPPTEEMDEFFFSTLVLFHLMPNKESNITYQKLEDVFVDAGVDRDSFKKYFKHEVEYRYDEEIVGEQSAETRFTTFLKNRSQSGWANFIRTMISYVLYYVGIEDPDKLEDFGRDMFFQDPQESLIKYRHLLNQNTLIGGTRYQKYLLRQLNKLRSGQNVERTDKHWAKPVEHPIIWDTQLTRRFKKTYSKRIKKIFTPLIRTLGDLRVDPKTQKQYNRKYIFDRQSRLLNDIFIKYAGWFQTTVAKTRTFQEVSWHDTLATIFPMFKKVIGETEFYNIAEQTYYNLEHKVSWEEHSLPFKHRNRQPIFTPAKQKKPTGTGSEKKEPLQLVEETKEPEPIAAVKAKHHKEKLQKLKKKQAFQHFTDEEKDVIRHYRMFSAGALEEQLERAMDAQAHHAGAKRDVRLIKYIKANPIKSVTHSLAEAGPPESMKIVNPTPPKIPKPLYTGILPVQPAPPAMPQHVPDEKEPEEKLQEPDPHDHIALPHPPVGPGAIPGDVAARTNEAWTNFEGRTDHSRAMRDLISAGLHKQYHFVNPLTYEVEHRERRTIRFQKRDLHSRVEEIHELKHHPMRRILEDNRLEKLSMLRDSTHSLAGVSGDLGRFINIKSLPSATDICIKRGVQNNALRILAKRILRQHSENPTRILLKRTKKGKFLFIEIISRKALSALTVEQLALKLIQLVHSRKKYTHLIVRPVYRGGHLHERIKANFTLL